MDEFYFASSVLISSEVYLTKCSPKKLFYEKSIKVLSTSNKASASDTIIMFGKLRQTNENSVMKISFPNIEGFDYEDTGLKAEIELYRTINTLLIHHFTPNIVRFIGFWKCNYDHFVNLLDQKNAIIFKDNAKTIYDNYNTNINYIPANSKQMEMNMLVMEKVNGMSLNDYINTGISSDVLLSLIFQIIFTLNIFNAIGIRHGDLHSGNIMIDTHNQSPFKTYILNPSLENDTIYYNIPTNTLAKIYDWDFGGLYNPLGGFPKIYNKKSSSMCATISSCNKNTKADLYTILGTIWLNIMNKPEYNMINQFIMRTINQKLLVFGLPENKQYDSFDRHNGFNFRLCKGPLDYNKQTCDVVYTNQKCFGDWEAPDCLIKSPYQAMLDPIFNKWKQIYPKDPFKIDELYGLWTNAEIMDRYYSPIPKSVPPPKYYQQDMPL